MLITESWFDLFCPGFLVQFFSSSLFLCYCSLSLPRTSLFCALLINFMPDWFLYLNDSQSSPVLFKIFSRERCKNEFYCDIWILRLFVAFINGNLSYLISHVYSLQFDNIFTILRKISHLFTIGSLFYSVVLARAGYVLPFQLNCLKNWQIFSYSPFFHWFLISLLTPDVGDIQPFSYPVRVCRCLRLLSPECKHEHKGGRFRVVLPLRREVLSNFL